MNSVFAIVVILIILLILVYHKLSKRIEILEKKISDLSQSMTFKNEEVQKKEILTETSFPSQSQTDTPDSKIILPDFEDTEPQRDWLTPVFDFLKQNALTIIGIFTLVLGIGYFVKYAIDKNWIGETSRAGIGFIVGMAIIGIGHFLRKNYLVFSSIITGGGIAVLYFTTTIAFREYHIFSQNVGFLITCLITIVSIALSYYYKSEILIIFSLFGGFLAPLMISTGQSNYLFLFTYLSVLNMGMLVIAYLKQWKSIGWISFIFTSIYLFFWTMERAEINAVLFYIITYVIFYAFALQNYIKKNTLEQLDILMLVLINFSSVAGLVFIFNELQLLPASVFPVVFALINATGWYREYQKKNFAINYSVFTSITISLITLAFALELKTHLITSIWAVEASLLLYIWKKTNHKIFKNFFYILFPMVIISQMITWTRYFDADSLQIIFNPVFITSLVVIGSCFMNLYLLKKDSEEEKSELEFYENIFKILCISVIYFSVLFEIIYHISEESMVIIMTIGFLYSLFYLFTLILFGKEISISKDFQAGMIYVFLVLLFIHISTSQVANEIITKKISSNLFFVHLLYIFPLTYLTLKIFPKSDCIKNYRSYWLISLTVVSCFSFELYRTYILMNAENLEQIYELEDHFNILYLPIIWAVLACLFIYFGLKKEIPEINKIGFSLLGIMIFKLYSYDVWQMDNVSRIIAFIILGIILLLSSFMFQRLKNLIKNLVDKKDETSNQNL
ncbi:DUF2339 domain-containing protein [Chryseobacterium sp. 09-1422]|uniref:DUF2339 domain-containing protein n=1 Tax=Chryseobacterium kimseyorum TaxID=2984028 RepID=A0ABT3HWX4_9FLAO|nr:DUF2339 domain-containing protein [Chryseobacterium kimseyorum]MCW3168298.1 DUF2339 domain-containing protein [Chryseobacterium kimseyorum]